MLSAEHRLTESALFASAVREGHRVGGPSLVIHLRSRESELPALVGFVVSKAVGNAVARNKVKRRLREIMRRQVERLPEGSLVVVRALPSSSKATFSSMEREVSRSLGRLLERPSA